MSRGLRAPLALQFLVVSLASFVLVSWMTVWITEQAETAWWRAGEGGFESAEHPYFVLLARGQDAPWTRRDVADWLLREQPNQRFAVYDAAGRLELDGGAAADAPVDLPGLPWGDRSVIWLDDGVQAMRDVAPDGTVRFGVTRYVPNAAQDRIASLGWYAALAAVVAAYGLLAGWFALRLSRPLQALQRLAAALSAGQLDARLPATGAGDELGALATTFNTMAERIRDLLLSRQVLLSQVAHELRTPLARLRVAMEIAADGDAERSRQLLVEMQTDVAELETLIADVLAYARLDVALARGDAHPVRRAPIQPGALLTGVVDRFAAQHPARPLDVSVAGDLPELLGDAVLLSRAVLNLLENADRYAPAGAPIALRASATPDGLRVEVQDRGPGIPEEELARVLEPFFRGAGAEASGAAGTGLGLSLCERVVTSHGGSLQLQNAPGGGLLAVIGVPAGANPG